MDNNEHMESSVPSKSEAGDSPTTNPLGERMAERLRMEEKNNRPNFFLTGLVLALLVFGAFGFMIWSFWPGPDPVSMQIFTYDEVVSFNQKAEVTVLLKPHETSGELPSLNDWPVEFRIYKDSSRAGLTWSETVKTKQDKQLASASTLLPSLAEGRTVEYEVSYAPKRVALPSVTDGKVFVWPPDANIVVVPVFPELIPKAAKELTDQDLSKMRGNIQVAKALNDLTKNHGYKVVYWVGKLPDPKLYRRLITWLESIEFKGVGGFPEGPRLAVHEHQEETNLTRLSKLCDSFSGKIVLAAKSNSGFEKLLEGTEACIEWLRTTEAEDGEFSWASLGDRLSK
ncbi:MAG: hypothetical protein ACFCD0_02460 [Gemmataceae bacterium]